MHFSLALFICNWFCPILDLLVFTVRRRSAAVVAFGLVVGAGTDEISFIVYHAAALLCEAAGMEVSNVTANSAVPIPNIAVSL